jgi:hypothetical protein
VITAHYNGKCVDMSYIADPKARFKYAGMRIDDNATSGYIVDGEKVYAVTRGKRTAVLLRGEALDAARLEMGPPTIEVAP